MQNILSEIASRAAILDLRETLEEIRHKILTGEPLDRTVINSIDQTLKDTENA